MNKWAQKAKGFRGISVKAQKKLARRLEEQKAELIAKRTAINEELRALIGEGKAELMKVKLLHKSIR